MGKAYKSTRNSSSEDFFYNLFDTYLGFPGNVYRYTTHRWYKNQNEAWT